MSLLGGNLRMALILATAGVAGWRTDVPTAWADEVHLEDGRILRGKPLPLGGVADVPKAAGPDGPGPQQVLMVDDELRRTFVAKRLMRELRPDDPGQITEKFTVWQQRPAAGRRVQSLGHIVKVQKFDEHGRRTFTFNTPKREVPVIQGITLITPEWTKVEGLNYGWDMRIATSSIQPEILHKILLKQIDPKDIEHHKKIARFYLQSQRYAEARRALEGAVEAFADQPDVQQQLAPTIRALRQLGARRLLSVLKARGEAGQHRLVLQRLKTFPAEDVAGEILQSVREMLAGYQGLEVQGKTVLKQIQAELAKVKDTALRAKIEPICKEIAAELNINTLGRLSAFRHVADDADLLPTEKLSFAISGWLLGTDAAMENLPVALSVYRVRSLVRKYLREPLKINRSEIFEQLKSEEGAVPGLVAGLIAHMKPPLDLPEAVSEKQPGLYRLKVRGLPKEPPVACLVQLPPEYDPWRLYPAIVTLHGAGTTASHQIDWWAGAWAEGGWRNGQATHHGYIVIAPQWTVEHQRKYGYSLREHAAVLGSLRDACKRFAIDTDRVFLAGHSIGGDAAWDIGLAHPDLWAGVIPVVARSDRYVSLYYENGRRTPLYFVCGELDGTKMVDNSTDLDRYLTYHTFNCTVVEYRGRGHEHFSDEILRIFDWMGRLRRDFFPKRFLCKTMRPWDNFFWYVELAGLPPKSTVHPDDWPPRRGTQAAEVKADILQNNSISVRTGTTGLTVWLSPEMIDFQKQAYIRVNGKRINSRQPFVEPNLETLLEDVCTRGDRRHPFWAKVETPTGR